MYITTDYWKTNTVQHSGAGVQSSVIVNHR